MCLHLVRPWKVCPDCFLLQLCFCRHPPHPPLALQWSWWAFWLLKCLGESTKNAAAREHNEERTHGWTFNPTKKKKQTPQEVHWRTRGKCGIQTDHNTALTPTPLFSSLFAVWSRVLLTLGWECCLQHVRLAKVQECLPSLSLFLSLLFHPPFFTHQCYCPMWPSIYHMNRVLLPLLCLLSLSPLRCPRKQSFCERNQSLLDPLVWIKTVVDLYRVRTIKTRSPSSCLAVSFVSSCLFRFRASASGLLQVNGRGVTLHQVHYG